MARRMPDPNYKYRTPGVEPEAGFVLIILAGASAGRLQNDSERGGLGKECCVQGFEIWREGYGELSLGGEDSERVPNVGGEIRCILAGRRRRIHLWRWTGRWGTPVWKAGGGPGGA
ncbi:hypothetical protein B0H12DRAFT_1068308 [Mycena haematopus]|nr:hypothetical protein B0H12DRAFT_1068308 [Mycena haematopus]